MDWLNLHTSILDSSEFIGADPTRRATWLCLLRYCIGQENGGRVVGCTSWSDRRWQQLARVTKREVATPSDLWSWDGSDLVVWAYPVDREEEVIAKRETARVNGRKGGRPREKPSANPAQTQTKPTLVISEKAEGEREREGERKDASVTRQVAPEALPFPSAEFAEAWANWGKHRSEIRKPLKPTMRKAQLAELASMGEARAIAALRHTIAKGWQGIREPDASQSAPAHGTLSGFSPRPSLGALQIELKSVRDEIADILHPGGCTYAVEPTGDKRTRYDTLIARRDRIQKQMESLT